jgi:transcriptional regulator with PAS, ATPase and Fis domain
MESTLFGHEQGSFTGARSTHIGKFEQANEGTIFLDEIAEMPINMQAKLLRVIEEGSIERVGGKKPIQINVRFIAATNRDINIEIAENRFREDLFYRLNVFRIKLPPLRERKEDIHQLVPLFIRQFSSFFHRDVKNIAGEYYHALLRYHWPGNIRELRNAVEYSLAIMEGTTLSDVHLKGFFSRTHEFVHKTQIIESANGKLCGEHFTDSQEQVIRQALVETGGNKLKAAKLLGISRATIHRKLKKMKS